MTTPYRGAEPSAELGCPRCRKPLPPVDIARCEKGCGVWVTAFASTEVFAPTERVEDRLTRWWRVRAPCPVCTDKMTLRGSQPGLFQGCDVHGFWVDADTVEHTGLARGDFAAKLDRKREDRERVDAEREQLERLEVERARAREAHHAAGAPFTLPPVGEAARRRLRYDDLLRALLVDGNPEPLVAELMRLDEVVRALERRVDELAERAATPS